MPFGQSEQTDGGGFPAHKCVVGPSAVVEEPKAEIPIFTPPAPVKVAPPDVVADPAKAAVVDPPAATPKT